VRACADATALKKLYENHAVLTVDPRRHEEYLKLAREAAAVLQAFMRSARLRNEVSRSIHDAARRKLR